MVGNRGQRFARLVGALDALSPLAVLARGYAIARRSDGVALTSSSQVSVGDEITVRLSTGALEARISTIHLPETPENEH